MKNKKIKLKFDCVNTAPINLLQEHPEIVSDKLRDEVNKKTKKNLESILIIKY